MWSARDYTRKGTTDHHNGLTLLEVIILTPIAGLVGLMLARIVYLVPTRALGHVSEGEPAWIIAGGGVPFNTILGLSALILLLAYSRVQKFRDTAFIALRIEGEDAEDKVSGS